MAIDVETLAAAMTYTDGSLKGVGTVQGKNCTIQSITKEGNTNIVVFAWTDDEGNISTTTMIVEDGKDGVDGQPGAPGIDGAPGKDGVDGKDGVIFTPSINSDGVLSWTNNGGLQNPSPTKIKYSEEINEAVNKAANAETVATQANTKSEQAAVKADEALTTVGGFESDISALQSAVSALTDAAAYIHNNLT